VIYADSSAVVTAYLVTEVEHERYRRLLLQSGGPILASELTRVEFAAAITAAARDRRVPDAESILRAFDEDCSGGGPIVLVGFRSAAVVARALALVRRFTLRAFDAIHIAVALEDAARVDPDEPLTFVTRDRRQAAAASALGLEVG
jgi:predicted nucleic acid-binding protein